MVTGHGLLYYSYAELTLFRLTSLSICYEDFFPLLCGWILTIMLHKKAFIYTKNFSQWIKYLITDWDMDLGFLKSTLVLAVFEILGGTSQDYYSLIWKMKELEEKIVFIKPKLNNHSNGDTDGDNNCFYSDIYACSQYYHILSSNF